MSPRVNRILLTLTGAKRIPLTLLSVMKPC